MRPVNIIRIITGYPDRCFLRPGNDAKYPRIQSEWEARTRVCESVCMWVFQKAKKICSLFLSETLTAFAVHICVALARQDSMFVCGSIKQERDGNKRVTTIRYPHDPLAPCLTLVLDKFRQALPQFLFLTANVKKEVTHSQLYTSSTYSSL